MVNLKLGYLRTFGCFCFASNINNHDKFSIKFEQCLLIGYCSNKKAYKFCLECKQVLFSRDDNFFENVFPFKLIIVFQKTKNSDVNLTFFFFFDYFDESFSVLEVPLANDD